ncbi:hypothetical protein [Candidatus Pantoea multigeneris]|uniref:Membrane transporter protein n=1 Tax=Candidatus Pantoea multigeneris TaxID=2608357 RepID=A0ABX0RBJ5_9GAMM|nr:hypothetical protein [Pantoea multigeneris]NIF22144.1 hypothetical protein [Pantoea multigeneris]
MQGMVAYKTPLVVAGMGALFSFSLPSTASLLSPRFLSLYVMVILAGVIAGIIARLRDNQAEKHAVAVMTTLAIIFLPVIKFYFSTHPR